MPSEEELLRRVKAEAGADWHLLIVEEEQRVVGMLALKLEERILDQLFVCPSHFGSGLGAALFDRAMSEMPRGFSLHTASTNGRARRFYERMGMKLAREGRHPRTGHPVVYYQFEPGL